MVLRAVLVVVMVVMKVDTEVVCFDRRPASPELLCTCTS
jgi:hypothetical protein